MEPINFKLPLFNKKNEKVGESFVDEDIFEELRTHCLFGDKNGYANVTINKKTIRLHRYIMKAAKGEVVDHINHNRIDNRRINLRTSDAKLNGENQPKSGGIFELKNGYRSSISINKITHNLGRFDNFMLAEEAIDLFLVFNQLLHKTLRYPEKLEQYKQKINDGYEPKIKENDKEEEGYYGVSKSGNTYRVKILIEGKCHYIRGFKEKEKAAIVRDEFVISHNLKGRKLNFPGLIDPELLDNYYTVISLEIVDENTIKFKIECSGDYCFIDKEDFPKIKYYIWGMTKKEDGYVDNGKLGLLHRYLLNVTNSEIMVDHIDHNKLNNKKNNLRIVDARQNAQNKKLKDGKIVPFHGIAKSSKSDNYEATIYYSDNNERIILYRTFEDMIIAARWRDLILFEFKKRSNHLLPFNFDDWDDWLISEWIEELDFYPKDIITYSKRNKQETKTSKYFGVHKIREGYYRGQLKYNNKELHFESKYEDHCARWVDLSVNDLKLCPFFRSSSEYESNFEWKENEKEEWRNKLDLTPNIWLNPIEKSIKPNKNTGYKGVIQRGTSFSGYLTFKGERRSYTNLDTSRCARWRDIMVLYRKELGAKTKDSEFNFQDWTNENIKLWKEDLVLEVNPWIKNKND